MSEANITDFNATLSRYVVLGVDDFVRDHGRVIETGLYSSLVKRIVGRLKSLTKESVATEGASQTIFDLRKELAETKEKLRRMSDAHKRLALECGKARINLVEEAIQARKKVHSHIVDTETKQG